MKTLLTHMKVEFTSLYSALVLFYKIIEKLLILDSESDAAEAADLYAVPGLDPDRYFKRAGFVGMRGKKQSDYASNYASYLRRPTLYDAMARNIRAGFVGMRG